jgi:hypothetical protein
MVPFSRGEPRALALKFTNMASKEASKTDVSVFFIIKILINETCQQLYRFVL